MTTSATPASLSASSARHPLEDGRTRCDWVRGRPEHYAFHDSEWGMFPDDEAFAQERLLLAALADGRSLVDVLGHRDAIWEKLEKCDLAKIGALSDAALDELARQGGIFANRGGLGRVRGIAAAGAETAKLCKGLREYFLTVRYLAPDEQLADMTARFPGFTRDDAAMLIELVGGTAGCAHDRDCWRA